MLLVVVPDLEALRAPRIDMILTGPSSPRVSSIQGSNALRHVAVGVLVLAVALFVINTIILLVRLTKRPYYLLSIETAGTSYRLLASAEAAPLRGLVHDIMKAIDNPAATFHYQIENLVDARGAKGFQIGKYNTQENSFS